MTSDERVYQTLTALGIPGAHMAYPEGGAPKPPFFVYSLDDGGEFFADSGNYSELPRYRVQLLMKSVDSDLESRVLAALREAFGPVRVYRDWSDSEHAAITSYYFTDTTKGE